MTKIRAHYSEKRAAFCENGFELISNGESGTLRN